MMEFRAHVRMLGIEAAPAEADELFRSLDERGEGALEIRELKPALRKLQASAVTCVTSRYVPLQQKLQVSAVTCVTSRYVPLRPFTTEVAGFCR